MDAIDAFISHVRESEELLSLIEQHLDDHMEKNPDTLTWAGAGDAARMREMLAEIVETFNLRRG